MAATEESSIRYRNTRWSGARCSAKEIQKNGMEAEISSISKCKTHHAKTKPQASASALISTLSVNNCRIKRPRLAPIASRMAISFCRAAERASRRPARLAHAIRSTMLTAVRPKATIGVRPSSGTPKGEARRTTIWPASDVSREFFPGSAGGRLANSVLNCACACCGLAPGRKRPYNRQQTTVRLRKTSARGSNFSRMASGAHTAGTMDTVPVKRRFMANKRNNLADRCREIPFAPPARKVTF